MMLLLLMMRLWRMLFLSCFDRVVNDVVVVNDNVVDDVVVVANAAFVNGTVVVDSDAVSVF